jgi:hypothetical protein
VSTLDSLLWLHLTGHSSSLQPGIEQDEEQQPAQQLLKQAHWKAEVLLLLTPFKASTMQTFMQQ